MTNQGLPRPVAGARYRYIAPDYMIGRTMTIRFADDEYVLFVRSDKTHHSWTMEWWDSSAHKQFVEIRDVVVEVEVCPRCGGDYFTGHQAMCDRHNIKMKMNGHRIKDA